MNVRIMLFTLSMFCGSCNYRNNHIGNDHIPLTENTLASIKGSFETDSIISKDCIAGNQIDRNRIFNYKFNVDSSGNILKSIIVNSGKTPIQTIETNKYILGQEFKLIDWNFDGFKDITVLRAGGSAGCSYWIWSFSKESGRYYYNTELSEKMGLEIDTISKHIVFHYRGGWAEEYWDTLKYENNKLSFIKGLYSERWFDTLGNTWEKKKRTIMLDKSRITKVDSSIID